MIRLLTDQPSIANVFLAQMRAADVQGDSLRFRKNMERLGEVIAYEISKTLEYQAQEVETPLGIAKVAVPKDRIVLATILRAGLPFHQGMHHLFDDAGNAFVSAYRKHHKDGTFEIELEYISCPNLDDATLILCDPMLASGASMVLAAKALQEYGRPKTIHFVTAIAARQGLDYLKRHFPKSNIWIGDLDEELTAKSYIVPGLGDAGDLSYGEKLQE